MYRGMYEKIKSEGGKIVVSNVFVRFLVTYQDKD